MRPILIKDLIKKDKQTLIKEKSNLQKELEQNILKYRKANEECFDKMMNNDLINADKCLMEAKAILYQNADIRDIIEKYNKALKRKEVK